jgi:hypothetical protein
MLSHANILANGPLQQAGLVQFDSARNAQNQSANICFKSGKVCRGEMRSGQRS